MTKGAVKAAEPKAEVSKAAPQPKAPAAKPAARKPATPRKPAAPRKPSPPVKPQGAVEQARAALASVPVTAKKGVERAKAVVAAVEVPEVTPRQAKIAAGAGGLLATIGAAVFLWRATKADQPDYTLVERDGDFEIREYPALVTAAAEARGPRDTALNRGFDVLADYIFAKSRSGAKLAMTAPVLSDRPDDAWRTRFIMPAGMARGDLPTAPQGVTLDTMPRRRVGAVRFTGRVDDALLETKEGALRSWLQLKSLPSEAKAVHAFYNSPMMPGPLRRNEVMVTLSEG
jgi:hypothetical protein